MGIGLAFAPFIAFAIIDRFIGSIDGLIAATLVSLTLILRDYLAANRASKLLEIGTLILFGGLTVYSLVANPGWSVIGVRLRVDSGLLLIVLISIAAHRPFTLQYAKEQVRSEFWNTPEFIRTNYIISAAWALAFLVMVISELALLYMPNLPRRIGVLVIVFALVDAMKFTGWYPERQPAAG